MQADGSKKSAQEVKNPSSNMKPAVKPGKDSKGQEQNEGKVKKDKKEGDTGDKNKEDVSPKKKKKEKPEKQANKAALGNVAPRNLEEQKELFFESDCQYDPQFEYENYEATQKFLLNYKEPSEDLMVISQKILDSFLETFGSETAYLESEGEIVSQEETEKLFQDYINELEFQDSLVLNF